MIPYLYLRDYFTIFDQAKFKNNSVRLEKKIDWNTKIILVY